MVVPTLMDRRGWYTPLHVDQLGTTPDATRCCRAGCSRSVCQRTSSWRPACDSSNPGSRQQRHPDAEHQPHMPRRRRLRSMPAQRPSRRAPQQSQTATASQGPARPTAAADQRPQTADGSSGPPAAIRQAPQIEVRASSTSSRCPCGGRRRGERTALARGPRPHPRGLSLLTMTARSIVPAAPTELRRNASRGGGLQTATTAAASVPPRRRSLSCAAPARTARHRRQPGTRTAPDETPARCAQPWGWPGTATSDAHGRNGRSHSGLWAR